MAHNETLHQTKETTMFQKKSKFNKLTESNVDHFNKYPRTYTATAVVGMAAAVLILVKFLKRNRTSKPEPLTDV